MIYWLSTAAKETISSRFSLFLSLSQALCNGFLGIGKMGSKVRARGALYRGVKRETHWLGLKRRRIGDEIIVSIKKKVVLFGCGGASRFLPTVGRFEEPSGSEIPKIPFTMNRV